MEVPPSYVKAKIPFVMDGGTDLSFKALDGFLHIRFAGNYSSYEQCIAVLQQIADKCWNTSCAGFLIDATEMTGMVLSLDRFRLMLSFARMLPPHVSVAVLVTRERHIPDYLLETLLRKYDIEGAEFVDRDAAIAWLNRQREPAQKAV
jgi:hypothetical protein